MINKCKTLSIIIPFFNVEQYLDECVESLFKQDIDEKDFEVFLVDDGSTDNSLKIANAWATRHSNISVYGQKNQGQAVARNLGLDKATGKYVMFVDSDDYLVNGTIITLLDIAENKNTDLCVFSIIKQLPDLKLKPLSARYKIINEVLTGEQVLLGGYNAASACAIIYKRDFIEVNHFRFRSGFAHEDVEFSSRVTAFAKRIIFTDIHSYVYRWNDDSTDRSKDIEKVKRGIISDLYIAHYLMEDGNNNICSRELKKYYFRRSNSIVVSLFLSLSKNKSIDNSFIKKCVETGKELGVYPVRGKTSSWKTTLLIPIINIESLIL